MKLVKEKSKPQTEKYTTLLYGAAKTGKTHFAAGIESAYFFAFEEGQNFQSVYKSSPKTWDDVRSLVADAISSSHDRRVFVWDTITRGLLLCEKYICKKHEVDTIDRLGFGKGFKLVREEFVDVCNALSKAGFSNLFIAHDKQKSRKDKDGNEETYMGVNLSDSYSKEVEAYCDFIFYAYVNTQGERLMKTKPGRKWTAGDRTGGLPDALPLDYKVFQQELAKVLEGGKK